MCVCVCVCVGVCLWAGARACLCACVCAFSVYRVEGVQNILCMWGILKVLKCISFPLIVVVEEGCVCVCVCVF